MALGSSSHKNCLSKVDGCLYCLVYVIGQCFRWGPGGGGGLLRYISHIGMCRLKGYGFWDFLV